jgi:hypothetical protein
MERPPLQERRRLAHLWRPAGAFDRPIRPAPSGTGNIDNDVAIWLSAPMISTVPSPRWLTANGFRENAAEEDPMGVMVRRNSLAGFSQLYLLDPDRNIIEIKGAP